MAGYSDYSKSWNAINAELEGRYPLTEASKIVAKNADVSVKKAKEVLLKLGTFEYHHTSKQYNPTDYYDTNKATNFIKYGTVESPVEIREQEKSEKDFAEIKRKRKECNHDWTINIYHKKNGTIKKSDEAYCPKCGKSSYDNIIIKKARVIHSGYGFKEKKDNFLNSIFFLIVIIAILRIPTFK